MKKLSVLLLGLSLCAGVFAEGYQVNLLSAKQSGMGHTGVAMKLGAESMHFNPAGMAFMEQTYDFSAGVSGIMTKAKYSHDGYHAKTDNDVSTPFYVYAGFKIYDCLAAGISLTTPYGSGIKWPDTWKGADLVKDITMKAFVLQPTISWRPLDNFSVGVGLMLSTGSFDLSRALLTGQNLISMGLLNSSNASDFGFSNLEDVKELNMISAKLHGKSSIKAGVNVGVMWDINKQWSVGAS